jgi:hypothetical protein
MTSRYPTTLREVPTNHSFDMKERMAPLTGRSSSFAQEPRRSTGSLTARSPSATRLSALPRSSSTLANAASPHADRAHRHNPAAVSDIAQEIADMFLLREKTMDRHAGYMTKQGEVNEKMRTILVDWLVDVHLKFKLHEETFFLAVNLIDRYLAVTKVSRSQLQLVGVTCMLLAAKYEEIWAPEVKDCIHISANTYTRDDILKMERSVTAALQFKLTQPTPFPLLARLLEVTDADAMTRHAAFFFLEHAVLDYKHLNFLPSQLANSALYLANVTLRKADAWPYTLQYYSKATAAEFRPCAKEMLEFANLITASKYQAIRRKYSSVKYGEISRQVFPAELPQ